MAKVKGYMEGNVGKVGNITYYRDSATGETVTRKIVTPKNPKTNAQTVQRVIAKQVGAMYSMMQEIADHSFQGKAKGAQCAAACLFFVKCNFCNLQLRGRLREQWMEDRKKKGFPALWYDLRR